MQAEHVVEVLKGRGVIKQATVVIAMTSNRAGSFEGVGVGGKSKAWISDLAQNFSHIPVVEQDVAHWNIFDLIVVLELGVDENGETLKSL